jgi:hypothetical protein
VPYAAIGPNGAVLGAPLPGTDYCGPDCCADGCFPGRFLGCIGDWFTKLGDGCCGANNCCRLPHVWARAEVLLWTIRNSSLPPLVSVSAPGVSPALPPGGGGSILYGGSGVDQGIFTGGRFTAGFALDCMPNLGFEGSYFFLGRRTARFSAAGDGTAMSIGRPFADTTGTRSAELVAFTPANLIGGVAVQSSSELWGAEGNLRRRLLCGCAGWLDVLGGFRYLELREDLTIQENLLQAVNAPPDFAISRTVIDQFRTRNQFYGGQLGLAGEYNFKRFFVGGQVKLAMGVMHQEVDVQGRTIFTTLPSMTTQVGTGGLLALGTNIGNRSRDRFAVVPEIGLKVGYNVTDNIRVFVGYDFLYASSVVRPGDQVDRFIDPKLQPTFGTPQTLNPLAFNPQLASSPPRPLFRATDFWAQGVTFGVEVRY